MKVLLLGYSDIAKRRVLPALRSLGAAVDIASRSTAAIESSGRWFRDYDTAISQTDAELVYISTVNNGHAQWTRRALEAGRHVAVDKPAFLTLEETHQLLELADRRRLCLAEATVYGYHPQCAMVREVFREAGATPTRLIAAFSVPPLSPQNFRYRAELGGGALWDLGPYAVTPGRIFFESPPSGIHAWRLSANDEVDTSFSMVGVYPDGRSCIGSFGYTTGYINRLDIIGPGVVVTMDRAFSPPPDLPMRLTVRRLNQVTAIEVPPSDSFRLFFDHLFSAIQGRNDRSFSQHLLADAEALHHLRESAFQVY
ncbi:MAG TPA: Gfo/Idh/MocA family oxidoreductase [Bryobacteraceae bacterium]|nr:Gfo/Idh/MocA family oxidoreductase [Bryobacteraceae bacterium]